MKPTKTQALWFLAESGDNPWYDPRTKTLLYESSYKRNSLDDTIIRGKRVNKDNLGEWLCHLKGVGRLHRPSFRLACQFVLKLKKNEIVILQNDKPIIMEV